MTNNGKLADNFKNEVETLLLKISKGVSANVVKDIENKFEALKNDKNNALKKVEEEKENNNSKYKEISKSINTINDIIVNVKKEIEHLHNKFDNKLKESATNLSLLSDTTKAINNSIAELTKINITEKFNELPNKIEEKLTDDIKIIENAINSSNANIKNLPNKLSERFNDTTNIISKLPNDIKNETNKLFDKLSKIFNDTIEKQLGLSQKALQKSIDIKFTVLGALFLIDILVKIFV